MAKRKSKEGTSGGKQASQGGEDAGYWPDFVGRPPLPIAEPSLRWIQFAEAHRGHPALSEETIYALPTPLINAIDREIPGFFSVDEQFERDLARLSGAGFFLRQPIAYEPMPAAEPDEYVTNQDRELRQRHLDADAEIRGLLSDGMRSNGQSETDVEQYWNTERQMHEWIDARKSGYAGWLVTHANFQKARRQFRLEWESRIRELGGFPTMPMSFTGAAPSSPPEKHREFWEDCQEFYREWALQGLATWELPIPMRPETIGPSLYYSPQIEEAGISLFLPWYLLRDKDLKLREVVEHRLKLMPPLQLREWLEERSENWGYERFAIMLKLYIYIELCLKKRHANRIKKKIGKLDVAFGSFLRGDSAVGDVDLAAADSVKKIRLEMQRRLKACHIEQAVE